MRAGAMRRARAPLPRRRRPPLSGAPLPKSRPTPPGSGRLPRRTPADGRYAQLLSDRREQAAAEKQQLQQGLAAGMEELVASFVQKLSS